MISQAVTSHNGMGDAAVETANTGCMQHCIARVGSSCQLGHGRPGRSVYTTVETADTGCMQHCIAKVGSCGQLVSLYSC